MEFSKKDLWTIPNILTYVRFACIPFFIWVMTAYYLGQGNGFLYAGFGIFIFASVTDVVDGIIARKFNQISDIGKIIDPMADKLLQCSAMIMLVIVGHIHWFFMVFLVVKELFMACQSRFFMVKSKKQIEQMANKWGKAGAIITFVGVIVAYASKLHKVIYYIDTAILTIGSILMLIAAVIYTIKYAKKLQELRASGVLDTLDKDGRPLATITAKENIVESNQSNNNDQKRV